VNSRYSREVFCLAKVTRPLGRDQDDARPARFALAMQDVPPDYFFMMAPPPRQRERFKDRLKALFAPIIVPIQAGPLQGKKWSIATGVNFIKGNYEAFKTKAVVASLKPGDIVFDVGAHVGYYSATAALLVGPGGRVFSFEPRPGNIRLFERHMRVNHFANVTLTKSGVGRTNGTARFDARTGTGTGHLADDGNLEISIVALDDWVQRVSAPLPDFLKIDVEGGEIGVLEGGEALIARAKPIILVATHGEKPHAFVLSFLARHGYTYRELDHEGHSGDVELLASPPSR
jgi:FkbM family methyltransferase